MLCYACDAPEESAPRLLLLVVLEIGTDWIKFCLITKFSEMQAKTFEAPVAFCPGGIS